MLPDLFSFPYFLSFLMIELFKRARRSFAPVAAGEQESLKDSGPYQDVQQRADRLGQTCRTILSHLSRSGLQYLNFQYNFKLYFCFNILDNDTIFSRNTPAKNGKTLTDFRIFFCSCLPAPQMELASVLCRRWEH